jgi:hypothetical protein
MFRRVKTIDEVILGVRFDRFHQGLLKPVRVVVAAFLNPARKPGRK